MCFNAVNVPIYAQKYTVAEVLTEAETASEVVTVVVSGNDVMQTADWNDGSIWDQVTMRSRVFQRTMN